MNTLTTQVTIKELRENLAEIVERVAIGKEEIIINKFGKTKAMIVPIKENEIKKPLDIKKLSVFGLWKEREDTKNSQKWVNKLRRHRV